MRVNRLAVLEERSDLCDRSTELAVEGLVSGAKADMELSCAVV